MGERTKESNHSNDHDLLQQFSGSGMEFQVAEGFFFLSLNACNVDMIINLCFYSL